METTASLFSATSPSAALSMVDPSTNSLKMIDLEKTTAQANMSSGSDPIGLRYDQTLIGGVHTSINNAPSLGDAILDGLQKTSQNYQSIRTQLTQQIQTIAQKPESLTSLTGLELQTKLITLNMHLDIASKVANKISQGIQTLFKNQ